MRIDPQSLSELDIYKLLVGIVVPRPIAWISTIDSRGIVNLAPFSAFTFVSNKPPLLQVGIWRENGRRKDTARNIFAQRCFVINIVSEKLLETAHATSAPYPPEASEAELLGVELMPGELISTPRIAGSPVQMECIFHSSIQYGSDGAEAIVGEVVRFHIDDELIGDGKIDQRRLAPVARLGGPTYATLGTILHMP